MLFAVLLDLDAGTQAALRPLADGLAAIPGLHTVLAHHLTLAVYDDLPLNRFLPALARFAETLKPMDLRLANVGIFTGVGSVLFLGPVVTTELLALHDRLHRELAEFASHSLVHYLPGAWVPHVTLARTSSPMRFRRRLRCPSRSGSPRRLVWKYFGWSSCSPFGRPIGARCPRRRDIDCETRFDIRGRVRRGVNLETWAMNYDAFIEKFTIWATAQPDIRAAMVIGSHARQQDPADEWSDVDIVLMARQPGVYLADARWLDQLGLVWTTNVEWAPVGGGAERRAMFEGALEVDFAILSSRSVRLARLALQLVSRIPAVAHLLPPDIRGQLAAMSEVLGRGARALVDKDGLTSPLPSTGLAVPRSARPSQEQFTDMTNRFWHGSVWVAKHLRRGELWRAKDGCDVRMKASILQLIEWHAKATKGWDLDTWALGRFLERWADPRIVAALGGAFAHYETEDVWRALFATMELFRWLARETADKLGLTYRTFPEERATEWVTRCHLERVTAA